MGFSLKNVFKAVIKFFPVIMSTIQHVEDTVHADGPTKLEKALEIDTAIFATLGIVGHDDPRFIAALTKVNNEIVALGNIAALIAKEHAELGMGGDGPAPALGEG